MKIVYFSQLPFTDNDFPLIRAFQQQGIDVYYYIQINSFRLRAGLIDIKEQIPINGIFKASEYQEFLMYKDYIDLDKIFVVNSTKSLGLHPKTILLYLKLVKHIKSFRANIIHITWPLMGIKLLLYAFRKKIVLTLHDPFPHSGKESLKFELYRRLSIALIDRIVMLNNRNVRMFCEYYNYPFSKILVTQMGEFDYMRNVKCLSETKDKPYILFFGYISQYKGVEILLESMKYIHEKYANIKLVVAGGGKIYFDKSLYEEQDYIEIRNCYIGIPELVGLLRGCLFAADRMVPFIPALRKHREKHGAGGVSFTDRAGVSGRAALSGTAGRRRCRRGLCRVTVCAGRGANDGTGAGFGRAGTAPNRKLPSV